MNIERGRFLRAVANVADMPIIVYPRTSHLLCRQKINDRLVKDACWFVFLELSVTVILILDRETTRAYSWYDSVCLTLTS
jgi:hypothetical protein